MIQQKIMMSEQVTWYDNLHIRVYLRLTSLPLVDGRADLDPLAQPLVRALPKQQKANQHGHK